jgi:diguanylate cyclase (GGDEF)-like protein
MPSNPNRMGFKYQTILLGFLFIGSVILQGLLPHDLTSIKGIISQINVAISVYLVVMLGSLGYRDAVFLNIVQFVFVAVVYVFIGKNDQALPGLVIPLITTIIIRIIRASNLKLEKRNEENVQQKRILEEQANSLKKLAYFDSLTNAINLAQFLHKVDEACKVGTATNSIALAYIDLDNFKYINDSMGHAIGDIALKAVSERLLDNIHAEDTLGRIGGDEFALLITREISKEELFLYLSSLISKLNRVKLREDVYSDVSASVGVAFYPDHASSVNDLLHCADVAMYRVKSTGKGRIEFFDLSMQNQIDYTVKIEQHMLNAFENNEFYILYQPLYKTVNRELVGLEALLRWKSDDLGFVSPELFIPIAERNGFIISLGKWVLKNACREFMLIKHKLPDGAYISINISPVQLSSLNFMEDLKSVIAETGMVASLLQLEITESALISDIDQILSLLDNVKSLGIKLSLDDFGKGYSSLHYLLKMPIDTLKIDRTYIADIMESKNRILVSSLIKVSRDIGIHVIAEGVETEEQLKILKEMKCDFIQGFLWGRPMPIDTWRKSQSDLREAENNGDVI